MIDAHQHPRNPAHTRPVGDGPEGFLQGRFSLRVDTGLLLFDPLLLRWKARPGATGREGELGS